MTELENADFYFIHPEFPASIRRISPDTGTARPHDLTDTPHRHDFPELVLVEEGRGRQVIDGLCYEVGPGDVFLIRERCEHYFAERESLGLVNVMFDPERLPLPCGWLRRLPGYNLIFELEPNIRNPEMFKRRLKLSPSGIGKAVAIAGEMESELQHARPGFEIAAFQCLLELIVFLSRQYDAPALEKEWAVMRMGKIISLLEREPHRNWSLKELAQIAASSENSLLRHFRTATGTTPVDYLIRVRLRKAEGLLKSTDRSVSEISEECGFRDSNYFSRKFHESQGISPREYRKSR